MQFVQTKFSQPLKIWEKIRIIVSSGTESGEYEARIEDFINGGIVITKPEFVQGKTLLRDDSPVLVQFTREDAAYQFVSRIKRASLKGASRTLLAPPRSFQRVQRRLFVRIETSTEVAYAPIVAEGKWDNWKDGLHWKNSRCVDISGGGVLLKATDELRTGMLLLMKLEFFKKHDLPDWVVGICRRVFSKEGQHLAGVEFLLANQLLEFLSRKILAQLPESVTEFDTITQNRLVSDIFSEQVELRQKGLL